MMYFIMGMSLMLNAMCIGFLCYIYYQLRKQKPENCYKELEFLLKDNNWGRIDDINPPPSTDINQLHTLVASAGRRDKAPQR